MPGSSAEENSPLVLVVDDDPTNLKLARDVLLAAGFRTVVAESGNEAVALAAEHLPDVILMDLWLPDMDGADAARILRDESRTAAIPVVLLSAIALEGDTAWLADVEFAGHLAKPIDIDAFPGEVRRFCRRNPG
ncbi:MAG TPA: response regulator [Gaiellaceae bacterium]|nr:response regulator [Gaiellaceae bacterium]